MRGRRALQLILIGHAVVHVLAFQAAWGLGAMEEFSAIPAFPATRVGSTAVHLLGALWLVAAIGFLSAATLLGRDDRRWHGVGSAAALVSLSVCLLWWRDAPAGAGIDLVLLGALGLGQLDAHRMALAVQVPTRVAVSRTAPAHRPQR